MDMESSMISTNDTSKRLLHSVSESDYSSYQESGWSFYLEDFSDHFCDLTNERGSFRSGCDKAVYVDHDLEDTASSPPPHNPHQTNTKHMMDNRHMYQEYNFLNLPNQEEQEGIYYGNGIPQGKSNSPTTDEMELGEKERKWRELGRKGLCLVPLSMLLDISPNFVLSM